MALLLQHRFFKLAATVLLIFVLLLLAARVIAYRGTWGRAVEGSDIWTYVLGEKASESIGSQDLEDWFQERILRGNTFGRISEKNREGGTVFNLDASRVNHLRFREFLTHEFGKDEWRMKYEPVLVLRVSRLSTVKIFENCVWEYPEGAGQAKIVGRHTSVDWPWPGPHYQFINRGNLRLSTSSMSYDGRSWPWFLGIAAIPTLLIYSIRRPVGRALSFFRDRS